MKTKTKLICVNFLQFAAWGAYLTSQGRYLSELGIAGKIGWFYSIQGIVSIFMPALVGIIADKWVRVHRMYGLCHLLAGGFMIATACYGMTSGSEAQFPLLFGLYTLSILFFMPTISLSYSVSFSVLDKEGCNPVTDFPAIRVWGTIGFICAMWLVDLTGFQHNAAQYLVSGVLSVVLGACAFGLPSCPIIKTEKRRTLFEAMGLNAFRLFKDAKMRLFFIFSMFLGAVIQISNGFSNPYLGDFGHLSEYAGTFGVRHSNLLISLSQMSEALFILLIPFCMKRLGIKKVMLIAILAWVFRFAFFGLGNPGEGLWLLILSMIVYGVAFDFFNVSGSLFVNEQTDKSTRSSAQGLFQLMTNGIGANIGALAAQAVINLFVNDRKQPIGGLIDWSAVMTGWSSAWFVFAAYALLVAILFVLLFPGIVPKNK